MSHVRTARLSVIFTLLALAGARAVSAQTTLAPQERMCDPAFEDCRADVLTYIQQETVEIDMGFWMMTDARYSNALVSAWTRGVKIRLLMDPTCVDQHPACATQNDQLQAAGIPMRRRQASGILHWKTAIFVGQGQLEFAGANYAPFELSPAEPYVNYTDEVVAFTNNLSLLHSFMTKFDDLWTSTAEFANYANVTGPLTRSFPIYPIDAELNFPPDDSYRDRAVAAYDAEPRKIDVQMFRITDGAHPAAMLRAIARGVPVRLITDETEYRNPQRLWDAYYVDKMYANGVAVRLDGHQGIDHEKAIALYGTGLSIVGSSNWTEPSSDTQREHNYFTVKPWVFNWLTRQFERKWNNLSGYSETKPFVPLPPDAPAYNSPSNGATGVSPSGAALSWNAGVWAHNYDIYFGTSANPPLLAANRNLGPSQSSTDYRVYALPALQPGTTYYWKVVSKTMANVPAAGAVQSFTTSGSGPAANKAPSVNLTAPSSGTTIAAHAALSLSASASDSDGSISQVTFYANGAFIGASAAAPYTTTWNDVPAGTYTVTAVAMDDRFATTTSTAAQVTVTAPPAAAVTLVRGPYLQQPTDHSMVIVWATRESGAAEVHYGVSSTAQTSVSATSRLVAAIDTGLAFDYYQYTATLGGLSSSTSYVYQPVLNGAAAAAQASFKTAPGKGSGAISFIAIGDSGTGSPEQRQIGNLISQDTFDFAMHVGDIAYGAPDGTGDASYSTYQSYFFGVYGWLPLKPFVPVEGNHDSRPTNGDGKAYLDLFELPRNGASAAFPDHAERYYSFDYGPVHFIALDTEFTFLDPTRQAEQLRWLAADLSSTSQPWKIAFLHRAPYSSGGEHGSSLDVRAAFGPLFERYGVDLVVTGHEHDYERTIPIRESTTPTDRFVPYVVTGGGGAPLYPAGTSSWTAFSASRNEYVKVTVDACTLALSAIGMDGLAFDGTTVTHCAPGNSPPSVALTSPSTGASFTAPASVTLTATASDSDGTVAKVDFYSGSTRLGTATAAPYTITWTNVPAGSYTLTAVATDNGSATTTSSAVAITVNAATPPPSSLPAGWSNADVGATGAAGSASASGSIFTVMGAGADVWGTADALQYAYRTLSGDGSIVARVASVQNVASWTKAGVMIRGSLTAGSAQAFMLVSGAKGVAFQRRLADGNTSVSTAGTLSTAPRWVKLTRSGSTISASESADGATWTLVGSDTFTLGASVDVGLAVSSHVAGTLATATFDNLTVTTAAPPPPANVPPSVALTSPSTGASFTAPASVTMTATASDSDGTVAKVDFYSGSTLLGTATAAPYTIAWTNVPAGSYSLTAVATDNASATTTSSAVAITVNAASPPPSSLPAGWSHADVGTTGVAGTASASGGTFTVSGAGADVWGTADALQYAYRTLSGDGSIVARVASVQNVASWTKAGVMIRGSLTAGSAQAFMLVSGAKGVAFQRRLADGNTSVSTAGTLSTAPRWVKLTRSGSTISAFESADGATWTLVGSDTFTLGATVDVGLAVSSHVTGTLATATFDNVTVTTATPPPPTNVPPSVALTSPTAGASFSAPASVTLTATASDSDGTVAKVDFYSGSTLLGTATTAPYTINWTNVAAGTYTLTAVATDNASATTTSSAVAITVNAATPPPSSLPAGWAQGDVGPVPFAGSATFTNGTFSVTGSGADIWGTQDQFHYAYRPLTGDGSIVARVASVQNVAAWVKAGLMIRETLAADSAHASIFVSAAKGIAFQRRDATSGISVSTAGSTATAPRWVRLTRSGNTFSAYESIDGTNWTLVGTDTIPMSSTVYIGLAVTSHTVSSSATCTFDGVTVQ